MTPQRICGSTRRISCSTRTRPSDRDAEPNREFDAGVVPSEHRRERRAGGEQETRQERDRGDRDDLARQSRRTEQTPEEREPRRIAQRVGGARGEPDRGPKGQCDGDAEPRPKSGGERRTEKPGRAGAAAPAQGDAQREGQISGDRQSDSSRRRVVKALPVTFSARCWRWNGV